MCWFSHHRFKVAVETIDPGDGGFDLDQERGTCRGQTRPQAECNRDYRVIDLDQSRIWGAALSSIPKAPERRK
jgi:hypothetical protein